MDVNTSFDKMANDVLLLVPKKDKLEARGIFFNYKKLHPHLFVADVEQFEKEQEALYEKLAAEEDGKRDRDCKYIFKKLLESMVVEDNPEIINMNLQSYIELIETIKGLQKSSEINTKRSFINILQIATLIQQSEITYKRKSSSSQRNWILKILWIFHYPVSKVSGKIPRLAEHNNNNQFHIP